MTAVHHRTWSSRLVVRQISELRLASVRRWDLVVSHERAIGFVFWLVLSASIAHRPWREAVSGRWLGIVQAGLGGRSISAAAIGSSMGLAETTVRRNAAVLIAAGTLVRGAAGYSVSPAFLNDEKLATIMAGDAADLAQMLSQLAASGHEPSRHALAVGITDLPPGVIARVLLTFALRTLETVMDLYRDLTFSAIVSGTIALNVRHITNDPELALRYAAEDEPPPDAERRPVSLRAVSAAIGVPFETVRRRATILIAEGIMVQQAGGVVVPTRVLLDAPHVDNNRRILLHFDQMVQSLVSLATTTVP